MIFLVFSVLCLVISPSFAVESKFIEANQSEFSETIINSRFGSENLNTSISHDINGDKIEDRIALEIKEDKSSYRVVVYLSSEAGFKEHELWQRKTKKQNYHGIWEIFWLKKEGENGESQYKYFNAPGKDYPYLSNPTDDDIKEYKAAVERYVSSVAIEATFSDMPYEDTDMLFYCMQLYYFESGCFHELFKCD